MRCVNLRRVSRSATVFAGRFRRRSCGAQHGRAYAQSTQEAPAGSTGLSALEAREKRRGECAVETFRIRGVSFDGRQAIVKTLSEAQPVALVKEPWNEHDANAIRVETLSGESLGYVPREITHLFLHPCTFGHVRSAGKSAEGLFGAAQISGLFQSAHYFGNAWHHHASLMSCLAWGLSGATVITRPELRGLTLDLFPLELGLKSFDLRSHMTPAEFEALRARTCKASEWTCQMTGAVGTALAENWSWEQSQGAIVLKGVECVHPDIRKVRHLPSLDAKEQQDALRILCGINQWTSEDCKTYLNHLAYERLHKPKDSSQVAWRLDLGWLEINASSARKHNQ